jgi:hypothetical protein
MVAALLPATSGWATDGSGGGATNADSSATAASASSSDAPDAVSRRARPQLPQSRNLNPPGVGIDRRVSSQPQAKMLEPRSGSATPAPMPESVNQAIQTLARARTPGPNSASTSAPVSTRAASGNSTVLALPAQVQFAPPADGTVGSNAQIASTGNPPAGESQPSSAAAEEPSRATTGPGDQDDQVELTGCATCGGFHNSGSGGAFHAQLYCADGNCIPGRQPCPPSDKDCDTLFGAFCANMYQELCCPDPCYEPTWQPAAYASLFADYARPRTVTRIRYDNLESMTTPDRNQFWIMQAAPKKMMAPHAPSTIDNVRMRLQQVYLYQEAAAGSGSFFVEIPYRQINPNFEPTQAGFGDINFGIKSLIYDRELLQISTQLRTYMPSGNFGNNLGNGQFAIDPSILTSLKLSPTTYFQGQFGNWIPLGGPGDVTIPHSNGNKLAGGIFYSLMSLNQVLWYPRQDSPLIATLEMDVWSFENGGFTEAIQKDKSGKLKTIQIEKGGGVSYFNIGPGLRQSICNRLDFGGALTFATGTQHWAQPWFRFEVRFLF